MSNTLFEITYRNTRRKHNHRCRHCWKIVKDGERVLMLRIKKGTWVLHCDCKDESSTEGMTAEQRFAEWDKERRIRLS